MAVIDRIMNCVSLVSFRVRVNDDLIDPIKTLYYPTYILYVERLSAAFFNMRAD